jgi:hypothetical protein
VDDDFRLHGWLECCSPDLIGGSEWKLVDKHTMLPPPPSIPATQIQDQLALAKEGDPAISLRHDKKKKKSVRNGDSNARDIDSKDLTEAKEQNQDNDEAQKELRVSDIYEVRSLICLSIFYAPIPKKKNNIRPSLSLSLSLSLRSSLVDCGQYRCYLIKS